MSTILASKSSSSDSLNVSTCHGRRFRAFQIRCTVSADTVLRAERSRRPSSFTVRNVSLTIASTVAGGTWGLRPRAGAITPTPWTPTSTKRSRHGATVFGYVRNSFAVERTDIASANANNARACTTLRCGNTDDRAIRSKSRRASDDTSMT